MLSVNTNNAAMAALQSLSMTTSALNQTENEVSTGLAVGTASDNPAIYAISQQMDGNIAGLSAVSTSLSFGAQVVGTATSASQNIISTLQTLQQTITQTGTSGINLATMQTQVANALNLVNTYARNSTFNGVNLLTSQADGGTSVVLDNGDGTTTTFEFDASGTAPTAANTTGANANKTVVVTVDDANESTNQMIGDLVNAMNENGYSAAVQNDGSINVTGQGLKSYTSSVTGLTAASSNATALSAGQSAVTTIQSAINKMTQVTSSLGDSTQVITGIQGFTSSLSDALTSGVGALTDADLSAESAKLTSLQTKQQLAIQSLSIANSQSQSILSLFHG